MRTRAGCRFRLTLALCLTLGASARAARAQSGDAPRLNAVVVHDHKTVPANGGVLILVPTGHPGPEAHASEASIAVLHAGDPVAGTLRDIGWVEDLTALSMSADVLIGGGWVWTAEEPLTAGERYDVRVKAAGGTTFQARFAAGKAWKPARPALEFAAELGSVDTGQREEHCCSPFLDGTGHGGCFVKRYAEVPALTPELGGDEAEEHLQQFLYLFRAFEPETNVTLRESGFRTYDSRDVPVLFLASQEQYCVELEAMHIVSGDVFHWSRCVSADELPDTVVDPTEAILEALQLEHCSVPEYGDVLDWCEINRDACTEAPDPDCALYDPLCGGTLPEALGVLQEMDAIRAARADAGTAEHADDHDADSGGAQTTAEHEGGCRTASGTASPSGDIGSLLVAPTLLWLRRRSRVRRSPG